MAWIPDGFVTPGRLDLPTGHHLRPGRITSTMGPTGLPIVPPDLHREPVERGHDERVRHATPGPVLRGHLRRARPGHRRESDAGIPPAMTGPRAERLARKHQDRARTLRRHPLKTFGAIGYRTGCRARKWLLAATTYAGYERNVRRHVHQREHRVHRARRAHSAATAALHRGVPPQACPSSTVTAGCPGQCLALVQVGRRHRAMPGARRRSR